MVNEGGHKPNTTNHIASEEVSDACTSEPMQDEGGEEPNTTHHIVMSKGGGVRALTPQGVVMDTPDVVMDVVGGVPRVTPPPTDVLVDHDAFRWGKVLLGASVTVLQVLSTTSPQSGKALARRLDVQPSTARYHLKKLRHLGAPRCFVWAV